MFRKWKRWAVVVPVVAAVVLWMQASSEVAVGNDVQEDVRLGVLDGILFYRGEVLRDKDATFVACDAWRAVGEPDAFPSGLQWAGGILEEKPEPCADTPLPDFPRVHVGEIQVSDSGAVATARVSAWGVIFSEEYRLTRTEDRFTVFEVRVFGFAWR